jgi:hypothetical protein
VQTQCLASYPFFSIFWQSYVLIPFIVILFSEQTWVLNFKNPFLQKIKKNHFIHSVDFVFSANGILTNIWVYFAFVTDDFLNLCITILFVTDSIICDRQYYLWPTILFVTDNIICDRQYYLWPTILFVTEQ